jgi:hypothetical protein
MLGMIVDAAIVEAAYVDGAYPNIDLLSTETADVERLAEWPAKGTLGLRNVGARSMPKEELLLGMESKLPDRFSLKVFVRAKPESFLEIGVVGILGNFVVLGDTEGGGLALPDGLVDGRSTLVWSTFDCKKALKTDCRGKVEDSASPKLVEFRLTYFASVLSGAFCVNRDGFSDENASYGNVSIA